MNFLSQIFPERSAHRDGLYLFSDFRVHFQEGDIDDISFLGQLGFFGLLYTKIRVEKSILSWNFDKKWLENYNLQFQQSL